MDDWAPLLEQPEEPEAPVAEEFDPSWPYTFKWGVSGTDGRTDVWRTKGGLDGMPTHRGELKQLWGRDPKVGKGDQMGMAQYIPAERKLTGELVAPPVVLVHPYYNQPVPQTVIDWFEQQFPNTVVRQAAATNDMKGRPVKLAKLAEWAPQLERNPLIRWVWNPQDGALVWESDEEGIPTHDQQVESKWGRSIVPEDYLGYAHTKGDEIEIDPIRFSTPSTAIAVVKKKLAQYYPDKHITSDQDLAEQYGVEFHGDPGKIARREAAAQWAETHLGGSEKPAEATERKPVPPYPNVTLKPMQRGGSNDPFSGLKRLFTVPSIFTAAVNKGEIVKKADADMSGAMIGLWIPENVAKKLKIKGGEPVENMHITLIYFQDKFADRDDWDEVKKIVERVANQTPKMTGKINGYGVFNNDKDVLWAVPSIQGLASLREKLFQACEDAGFPVSKTYDWAPHITLKYDFKGKLPKIDEPLELDIPELTFAQGNNRDDYKFEGHFEKEAGWGAQDWDGWGGTHRFVTDGKEVLTAPVSGDLDDRWVPDLDYKFRQFYPDAQHLAQGFAVPTADEMGYGIYAPRAGWGHPDEPGLHEIVHVLDKHFGKPTHFIESDNALHDKERYRIYPDWDRAA